MLLKVELGENFSLLISRCMRGVLQMETRYVREVDGRYEADIDITVEEWKSMLQNPEIFHENDVNMVLKWYNEVGHQATSKAMMEKYSPELKASPYNGIVTHLTPRILKHLNRFEVKGTTGGNSTFIVPFEGWYENYKEGNPFIWKLRDELVQALEDLDMVGERFLPSEEDFLKKENENFEKALQLSDEELLKKLKQIEARKEKKTPKQITSQRHDRNSYVAAYALRRANGLCQLCGKLAPFIKLNGTPFLEVHHIQWLSEEGLDVPENTVALCPNCHRKMHILDLKEDKDFLKNSVQKIVD